MAKKGKGKKKKILQTLTRIAFPHRVRESYKKMELS
jgi:hypothetical protein